MHRKQKNEMNRKYYLNVKKLVYQSFKFKNAYQTVAYVLNRWGLKFKQQQQQSSSCTTEKNILHFHKDQTVNAILRNNHCLFSKKNTVFRNMMLSVHIHCESIIMSLFSKPVTEILLYRIPAFIGDLESVPPLQFSFQRKASKGWPPACKQVLHLLNVLIDTFTWYH